MTHRPYETNLDLFALWNPKRSPTRLSARRVAIAHRDVAIGDSFSLLLGLKGVSAQCVVTLPLLSMLIDQWNPQALLIDTRLVAGSDSAFVRTLQADPAHRGTLLMAMSNFLPEDSADDLRDAGFDGHCRRPCPMWRMADLLANYFAPA